jgi:hypothetical protein
MFIENSTWVRHFQDMKVTSRAFQRDFARMKAKASSGETVTVGSDGKEFHFRAVQARTWQRALKGKIKIKGNFFCTGLGWEALK